MVKTRKNIVAILIIIAILSPIFTNLITNAVEPEDVTLSLTAVGSTTNLDIGDNVEVSLDLNKYLDNQNAMVIKLTYDHNVLQPIPDSVDETTNKWGNKTFKNLDIYSDVVIAMNTIGTDDILISIGGTGTSVLEYENTDTNHIANFKFEVIGTTNTSIVAEGLIYSQWGANGDNQVDTTIESSSTVNLTMLTPEVPLTAIEVTGPESVNVGETITLTAAKVPAGTSNTDTITWESTNPAVASVDSNGVVTGHEKGGVSIFAKCGNITSAAHPVDVNQPLLGLIMDKPELTLSIGGKANLTAFLNPGNANTSGNPISWVSSNSSFVKINGSTTGDTIEIEAVANGNATITASLDGKQATSVITVSTDLTALEIKDNQLHVMNNSNYPFEIRNASDFNNVLNLTASKIPSNTDNTANITWSSSNPSVATVATINANGTAATVTPIALGTSTITAACGNVTATLDVTVNVYINEIEINSDDLTLYVGQSSDTLTIKYVPANFSDESSAIIWSSSDDSVATVNNGIVTAVSAGDAVITAALASNPNVIFDTINVNVPSVNASGLTINFPSKTLNKGETVDLVVELANNSNHNLTEVFDSTKLTWESNNTEIASVDANGRVQALSVKHNLNGTFEPGIATITAKYLSNNGEITATCAITVLSPLQSIALVKASNNDPVPAAIDIENGESYEALTVQYVPDDTTSNRAVTWTTSGESASVSNGVITANKPGDAVISAKVNGVPDATVTVSVYVKLDSLVLEDGAASINIAKNNVHSLKIDECAKVGENENPTEIPSNVVWTTSNPNVITVEDGIITAVGNPGEQATIGVTYTMADDRQISTSILVKIKEIHATGVTITPSSDIIFRGQDILLNVNISQEEEGELTDSIVLNTTDEDVASIVKINGQYYIHAGNKLGVTATLTFTVGDKSDTLQVSLSENHITDFTPELNPKNIVEGKDGQITVDPNNYVKEYNNVETTDNPTITYLSLTETIATVDATGKVHALKIGNAQVKVTLSNGTTSIDKIIDFKVTASSPIYDVLEGKEQLYNKDSCVNLQFRIDANYNLFTGGGTVYVDENEVDPSNYTTREGSTIIEFTEAFSRSIGAGAHTLSVLFTDGNTSVTDFNVIGDSNVSTVVGTTVNALSSTAVGAINSLSNSPHTGDMNVLGLSILAIVSLMGMVIIIKKNRF